MSIQGLMNKGTPDCSFLEKTADACLALPRKMWMNREVYIEGKDLRIKSVKCIFEEDPFCDPYAAPYLPTRYFFQIFFGSIAALPFLLVGLAFKEIVLLTDKKAKSYHTLVEMEKEKEHLQERIKSLGDDILVKKHAENLLAEIKSGRLTSYRDRSGQSFHMDNPEQAARLKRLCESVLERMNQSQIELDKAQPELIKISELFNKELTNFSALNNWKD